MPANELDDSIGGLFMELQGSPSLTSEVDAQKEATNDAAKGLSKHTKQCLETLRSVKQLWTSKTGIDWPTYKLLFKGAIAPTIGLAAAQATPWLNVFGTLGYLVAMVSIIAHTMPQRARFLELLLMDLLYSSVSAAVTALALFSIVKARQNSSPPIAEGEPVPYNSDASTVAAIWLIVMTFVTSAIRWKDPMLAWPCSTSLIYSNFGMVYGPQFGTMGAAMGFLRRLVFAHLIGFGISIGVALFIFPTDCRQDFFKTVVSFGNEVKQALHTNKIHMQRAERGDVLSPAEMDVERKQHKRSLDTLQAKLVDQLSFAQKELAIGMLGPDDLKTLKHHLDQISTPLIGLGQIPELLGRSLHGDECCQGTHTESYQQYRRLLQSVLEPFCDAHDSAAAGIQHSFVALGLQARAATSTGGSESDEKAHDDRIQETMSRLLQSKADLLEAWKVDYSNIHGEHEAATSNEPRLQPQQSGRTHLHMLLCTEMLLWSICRRVQQLVLFVEDLKATKVLQKKRLILPVWLSGQGLASKIRRHHKPRKSPTQQFISLLRSCTNFLASPAAGFGLRVTCATMSIAIVAFLRKSQHFYTKQHLLWAQYAVSFALQTSAGQSIRHWVFRMGGTLVAALLSWISWYIVVGHPAGVLVFYCLSMHFPIWIMIKQPRFGAVGTVSAFTMTVIIGNALQLKKMGPQAARAAGEAVQPTILLGAIRLAALSGGMLLATIWTLFPYPISEHDKARKTLGAGLASLAECHTGFQAVFRARLRYSLDRDRQRELMVDDLQSRLFSKCNGHLRALRAYLGLSKWNLSLDGPLPVAQYQTACNLIEAMIRNMQLLAFASASLVDFIHTEEAAGRSISAPQWLIDFQSLFSGPQQENIGVAALLGLMSHSISTQTPLPLHLRAPAPQKLYEHLNEAEEMQRQIEKILEPGHAAFALMRIGTKCLYEDLGKLLVVVRGMAGEMEFLTSLPFDEE